MYVGKLIKKYILPKLIVFPSKDELPILASKFSKRQPLLPGAVTAMDGTHIPIRAPKESPEAYFNYKSFFSYTWLVVCDGFGLYEIIV